MQYLQEIDKALGTWEVAQRDKEFRVMPEKNPEAHKFLGRYFVCSETPGVRTSPNKGDVEVICKWIKDARRQADLVVVSLHAHEGPCGDSSSHEPAEFITEAARQFIDAGADVFVGHGPHVLRPVETYKGKPIFYSLGNFMFMFETGKTLPSEMYEQHKLPPESTPADVQDVWSHDSEGNPVGFHRERRFWQSVVPVCKFTNGSLSSVTLHPITLNLDAPRSIRGLPQLADAKEGLEILQTLSRLSESCGTRIEISRRNGRSVGQLLLGG